MCYLCHMYAPALDQLLEAAPGGGFTLDRSTRENFDDDLLRQLHALANELMAESFEHFLVHAHTNDELHVFRRRGTGDLVGFQFWRAVAGVGENERVVFGGKLRVQPRARRVGLHIISGYRVLLDQARAFPNHRIIRLGVASLFGFVSITRRLAHYAFVDAAGPYREFLPLVEQLTGVSNFEFDPTTGQTYVGIQVTHKQLEGYPEAYFERPEAQAYLKRNPEFRTNGCFLVFAFEFDEANRRALAQGAVECTLGSDPSARQQLAHILGE